MFISVISGNGHPRLKGNQGGTVHKLCKKAFSGKFLYSSELACECRVCQKASYGEKSIPVKGLILHLDCHLFSHTQRIGIIIVVKPLRHADLEVQAKTLALRQVLLTEMSAFKLKMYVFLLRSTGDRDWWPQQIRQYCFLLLRCRAFQWWIYTANKEQDKFYAFQIDLSTS